MNGVIFKFNYNQFNIKPVDVQSVLTAFPQTTGRYDDVWSELLATNLDESNYKKVMLNHNVWIKMNRTDDGFSSVYTIGMDDGMPESIARDVFIKLRHLEIDFKLNGTLKRSALEYNLNTEEK